MQRLTKFLLFTAAQFAPAAPGARASPIVPADSLSVANTLEVRQDIIQPLAFPPDQNENTCPYPQGHSNYWASWGFEPRGISPKTLSLESRSAEPDQSLEAGAVAHGDLDKRVNGIICNSIARLYLTNVNHAYHNTPEVGVLVAGVDYFISFGLDTVVRSIVLYAAYSTNPNLQIHIGHYSPNSLSGAYSFTLNAAASVHAYFVFSNGANNVNGEIGVFASNVPSGLLPINP